MAENEILIPVGLDKTNAIKDAKTLGNQLENEFEKAGKKSGDGFSDNFKKEVKDIPNALKGVFGGALLGSLAGNLMSNLGGLVSTLKEYRTMSLEGEMAAKKVANIIKQTGTAAGITSEKANELANNIQKMTNFEADAALEAEGMLLKFNRINKDIFPQTLEMSANLATAMGTDITTAAQTLGKALNSPMNGTMALSKLGIKFTEQEQKKIKVMQESGDIAGAQAIILAELEKRYGNLAKNTADPFIQLQNYMDDIKESIGLIVGQVIRAFGPAVITILSLFAENLKTILITFGALATIITAAFLPSIYKSVAAWIALKIEVIKANAEIIKNGVISVAQSLKAGASFVILAAKTALVTAAQWLWNIAMSANPIGLIIAGVAALVAGIILLWKNIDVVIKWFKKMWDTIVGGVKGMLQWLGLMDESSDKTKKQTDKTKENTKAKKDNAAATADQAKKEELWQTMTKDTIKEVEEKQKKIEALKLAIKNLSPTTKDYSKVLAGLKDQLKALTGEAKKGTIPSLSDMINKYVASGKTLNDLNKDKETFNKLHKKWTDEDKTAKTIEDITKAIKGQNTEIVKGIQNKMDFATFSLMMEKDLKAKREKIQDEEYEKKREKEREQNDKEIEERVRVLDKQKENIKSFATDLSNIMGDAIGGLLSGEADAMKNFLLALIDMTQKAINIIGAEILANQIKGWTSILPTGGQLIALGEWAGTMALINGVFAVAKASIGAEQGTDMFAPLTSHTGKVGSKDTVPMLITPKEARYGILSDSALDVNGKLVSNRELAQVMNSGQSAEQYILGKYAGSNFNDSNIVGALNVTNYKLSNLEKAQMKVAKRFDSHHSIDVNVKDNRKVLVKNSDWRN